MKVLGEVGVRKERDWSRRGKDGRSKKELHFLGSAQDHASTTRASGELLGRTVRGSKRRDLREWEKKKREWTCGADGGGWWRKTEEKEDARRE